MKSIELVNVLLDRICELSKEVSMLSESSVYEPTDTDIEEKLRIDNGILQEEINILKYQKSVIDYKLRQSRQLVQKVISDARRSKERSKKRIKEILSKNKQEKKVKWQSH